MNIVFDVGNVLLAFDPRRYLAQAVPHYADALMQIVFQSEEWQQLDRGAITLDEACRIFAGRRPDLEREILAVMHGWVEMLVPIHSSIRLLEQWSGRHRLFYLSNMPEQAALHLLGQYRFWELFEGGIFSYTTGLIKPDHAIYRQLLTQFRLQAGGCVFIDDMQANVGAAIAVGMQGILFHEGLDLSVAVEAAGRQIAC